MTFPMAAPPSFPTLTHRSVSAHCSESCEDGATSENSSSRNCPKRDSEVLARYPAEHEKTIPHRPLRCRMDLHGTTSSHPESYRPTSDPQSTRNTQRYL